jgi:hypothetical protein
MSFKKRMVCSVLMIVAWRMILQVSVFAPPQSVSRRDDDKSLLPSSGQPDQDSATKIALTHSCTAHEHG